MVTQNCFLTLVEELQRIQIILSLSNSFSKLFNIFKIFFGKCYKVLLLTLSKSSAKMWCLENKDSVSLEIGKFQHTKVKVRNNKRNLLSQFVFLDNIFESTTFYSVLSNKIVFSIEFIQNFDEFLNVALVTFITIILLKFLCLKSKFNLSLIMN